MSEFNIKVSIINKSNNPNPSFSSEGSAGVDIRAFVQDAIVIEPLSRVIIPTGLFIELPRGFEAQIRSRSGLAFKNGIFVLNSPGTIDSDYRGEIKVILMNLSQEKFIVNNGDRICQMVFSRYYAPDFINVSCLSSTDRSSGGFGHSGVK